MRTHQLAAIVTALTATLATQQVPALAAEEPPGPQGARTVTATDEQDCYEVLTTRGVVTTAVDALVPDRYGIATTPTISLAIITYTCRDLAVDRGDDSHAGTTTVSIGSVAITSVDGVPTVGAERYVLGTAPTTRGSSPACAAAACLRRSCTDRPRVCRSVDAGGERRHRLLGAPRSRPLLRPGRVRGGAGGRAHRLLRDVPARASRRSHGPPDHSQSGGRTSHHDVDERTVRGDRRPQPLLTDPRFNTVPQPGQVARFPYLRGLMVVGAHRRVTAAEFADHSDHT